MHHNERDGQIIGRIKAVRYTETDTRSNTPALEFTVNIGNEEGIKGIKDGTLSTVSIGVIAHDLRCSICGTNLVEEGMCEHEKGEVYDNELCYWIINKMEPKEVSYVIVPSDIYAHNIKVYEAINKKKSEVKESMQNNPFAELLESTQAELNAQESKQIDEEIKSNSEEKIKDETVEETSKEEKEKKEEVVEEEDTKEEENKESSEELEKEETQQEEKSEEESDKEEASEDKEEEEELVNKSLLDEATAKIEELNSKIKELEKENSKLEKKVEKITSAKESVEKELVLYKAEKKKGLVETVNKLREELSLPVEETEMLMESSEESLMTTIKSLKEFTQVQKKMFGIQTLSSPVAVSEEMDNTSKEISKKNTVKNVKESVEDSNKTLEAECIDLMMKIF